MRPAREPVRLRRNLRSGAASRDGSRDLSYLCAAYKRFFRHIAPYMRVMANELAHERAPANVMRWTRDQDLAR